jgi:hypothetical protein
LPSIERETAVKWNGFMLCSSLCSAFPDSGYVVRDRKPKVSSNSTGWTVSGSAEDLDRAVDAASGVFKEWRHKPAYDRAKIIRKAADILREGAVDRKCVIIAYKHDEEADARLRSAFGVANQAVVRTRTSPLRPTTSTTTCRPDRRMVTSADPEPVIRCRRVISSRNAGSRGWLKLICEAFGSKSKPRHDCSNDKGADAAHACGEHATG